MYRRIIGSHQLWQYIDPPIAAMPGKVPPHFAFQSPIKPFTDRRLELRLDSKEANIFHIEQVLHMPIGELPTFINLQAITLAPCRKYFSKGPHNLFTSLVLDGHCPGKSTKQVNDCQHVPIAIINFLVGNHFYQVGLPLLVNARHLVWASTKSQPSRFVQCISSLPF